jgi:hypothetical protein
LSTGIENIYLGVFRSNGSTWSISNHKTSLSLSAVVGSNIGTWYDDVTGDNWGLGGFTGGSETHYLDGWIREVLVYERELDPVEEGSIIDDFDYRYGESGLVIP